MLDRPLNGLSDADLRDWVERLVNDRVHEQTTLDYKSVLDLDLPKTKLDFARDVSAFANESGGELVIGIRTMKDDRGEDEIPTGDAPGIEPIPGLVPRLMNALGDHAHPRVLHVEHRIVGFDLGKVVYVFRVPQSRLGPHMVGGRYYHRAGHRSHEMGEYLVRERYRETLSRESLMREFLSSPDILSHEAQNPGLNLRVALLPYISTESAVDFSLNLRQRIQILRGWYELPTITWFGAQDSDRDESWRYYSSGEIVVWCDEEPYPVEGWPSVSPDTMHAPFTRMVARVSQVLWLARLIAGSTRIGSDRRLLVQWRAPTDNPLIPDNLAPTGFGRTPQPVLLQERRFIRAAADVTDADLESPGGLMANLVGQLGRYFGRSELAELVTVGAATEGEPRVVNITAASGKHVRLWPPHTM